MKMHDIGMCDTARFIHHNVIQEPFTLKLTGGTCESRLLEMKRKC